MRERPIIMGADSVRAILDGRKTQTRRVINPHKYNIAGWDMPRTKEDMEYGYPFAENGDGDFVSVVDWCPYGRVGDRLWVRETWGVVSHTFDENENICDWKPNRPATPIQELKFGTGYYDGYVIYEADGGFEWNAGDDCSIETKSYWKSSMFMPRRASRITLEITDIRVERVQDISEEDALAEGVISDDEYAYWAGEDNLFPCPRCEGYQVHNAFGHDYGITEVDCTYCDTQKKRYRIVWDSLNAKRGYPWESNPWVWVISFKRVHNQKEE